jgi:hypothetical protein
MMRAAALFTLLVSGGAFATDVTYGEHGMALFAARRACTPRTCRCSMRRMIIMILQVHVADKATDAALRKRLDGKTALWTIAPEKFELSRLAPQALAAASVQGRPGAAISSKAQYAASTIVVDKVLMFRKLSPEQRASSTSTYMQIGSGKQRYLVKQIDSRPDYDHILSYRAAPGASTDSITVIKQDLREPSPAELATALHTRCDAIKGTIYFYTDDLK